MIAVLDACTLINLLLTVNDSKYIKYSERIFDEISIVHKVHSEVIHNRKDNGVENDFKVEYERIIFTYLSKFIKPNPDLEAINCVKEAVKYTNENGELFSVAYALYTSRFGGNSAKPFNLLQVHFFTDDEAAANDFNGFYEFNHIGKILSSIDLLVFLSFQQMITKGEVINYCRSLKQLYSRPVAELGKELKLLVEKGHISSAKERLIAIKIIEIVNEIPDDINEQLSLLIEKPESSSLFQKNKQLKSLLQEVLQSNFRQKIPAINNKQLLLQRLWLFNDLN